MPTYTRGEFLGMSALVAGAFGIRDVPPLEAAQASSGNSREADLAVINGRVFTVDDAMPRAEAFAVKDGRFMAVGSTSDIRNLITPRTQVIDAATMTVTPGFIDAHCHPAMSGLSELLEIDCNRQTIAEIKDALRARAGKTAYATGLPESFIEYVLRLERRLAAAETDILILENARGYTSAPPAGRLVETAVARAGEVR